MELYKLNPQEHGKTRKLWEDIFQEDTKEFLDYYYKYKVKDNQIYVIEEGEELCAMLQLNPYRIQMRQFSIRSEYIIAVATRPEYRHQGLMRRMLHRSMRDMYEKGQPFTFLMPAAKEIYLPFDFRFIYDQKQMTLEYGPAEQEEECTWREAQEKDAEVLAAFSNQILEKYYDVFAARDSSYFQTLIHEQRSENGGIALVYKKENLAGYFLYARGEHIEVREPVFLEEYSEKWQAYTAAVFKGEDSEIKVLGLSDVLPGDGIERVPTIMARITNLEEFVYLLTAEVEVEFTLGVKDPFLAENEGFYRWRIDSLGGHIVKENIRDSQETVWLEISDLVSWCFGYISTVQLADRLNGSNSDDLIEKLEKIDRYHKNFLNEVV